MNANTEDPAADIAWMRRLAEEGAQAPMQGASILFGAGLIWGLASLGHWAITSRTLPIGSEAINYVWLGGAAVFAVLLIAVLTRLKREGGVQTAANRAVGTAWSAVGWGVFALGVSMAALGWRLGEVAVTVGFALIPSMIMVAYGSGWAVSATMLRSRGMWWLAIASFAAAPALAALTGMAEQYLAYAAALFLLMALPGFRLMQAAKRG
ncbi:MAG: hypothetical protein H2038_02720 [Brevundimonas sp.]|jgi:hypothetical protein|uniref:hypothetical protein n=1 Tax=Brevundimonas sp. TaxID=1871086 RepID=UPI00180BD243|nr:hypothetical protein [Brevundimonas sp.]MBA4803547.1 hypothetical protein [Brevundimonas sp.]